MLYTAVIPPYRDSPGFPTWTPATRNVRVPVGVSPQRAPDAIAQGSDTPSRRAVVQVATAFFDTSYDMEERFLPIDVLRVNNAWSPRGRQLPWIERANTVPPQHVAYGSLFVSAPTFYGYS
jgi:hypothetical protein